MLRSSGPPPKPDIKRAIDDLLKEDARYDQSENRSAHRENLVRHLRIELRQSETSSLAAQEEDPHSDDETNSCSGFSRNISATGVGLISKIQIQEKAVAMLSIDKLGANSKPLAILSECRWCRPYGDNWFLSGWQFISLKR